jgi:hypothetical protein
MQILLSTTGTASPVVLNDLNRISFTHPTSNFDLLESFTLEELYESDDLINAVDDGHITLKDDQKNDITSNYQLSPVAEVIVKKIRTTRFMTMGG